MEFSRQGYWRGLSFASPGDLPSPGVKPGSPALRADELLGKPTSTHERCQRAEKGNIYIPLGVDLCWGFPLIKVNFSDTGQPTHDEYPQKLYVVEAERKKKKEMENSHWQLADTSRPKSLKGSWTFILRAIDNHS